MCAADLHQMVGARGRTRTMIPAHSLTVLIAFILGTVRASASISRGQHNDAAFTTQLFGWNLELKKNEAILSTDYSDCQFYKGIVVNETESAVFLTNCQSFWFGFLQIGSEVIELPPDTGECSPDQHPIRRRDLWFKLDKSIQMEFDLTNDTTIDSNDDLSSPDIENTFKPRITRRSHQSAYEDYFKMLAQEKRHIAKGSASRYWMEVALVADNSMLAFHKDKTRLQHYLLSLMNVVSTIFNHHSLEANITIVVTKTYILQRRHTQRTMLNNDNIHIDKVIKWNKRHLEKIDANDRWDALLWFTKTKLKSAGLAKINKMCTAESISMLCDEGITTANIIAHEIAHLLGVRHDNDTNCPGTNKYSVMRAIVTPSLQFQWSTCSRDAILNGLRRMNCLKQRSGVESVDYSSFVPTYSRDEQCHFEFGDGYTSCHIEKLGQSCSSLWCELVTPFTVSTCKTNDSPVLEGTFCKEGHQCFKGNCTRIDEMKSDGGKSERSDTKCSARCGYGFTRNNFCDTSSIWRECSSEYESCWSGQTCSENRDVRAELCRGQSPDLIPFLHSDDQSRCQLWCTKNTGGQTKKFWDLPDGTSCSYARPYDVCYKGFCIEGACNPSDDSCNLCARGQCKNQTQTGQRIVYQGWTSLVEIPQGTTTFFVNLSSRVPLTIAIRTTDNDNFKLDDHNEHNNDVFYESSFDHSRDMGIEGRLVAAGTLFEWIQMNTDYIIWAESPLTAGISLLAKIKNIDSSRHVFNVTYVLRFTTPVGVQRSYAIKKYSPDFTWMPGEWEACSNTCGNSGLQERQLYCVPKNVRLRTRLDLIRHSLAPVRCNPDTRPADTQPCSRLPCPVYWEEMPWTECSKTCGSGIQYRPWRCQGEEYLCGPKPPLKKKRCRLQRCPRRRKYSKNKYCNVSVKHLRYSCRSPLFLKYCSNMCRYYNIV